MVISLEDPRNIHGYMQYPRAMLDIRGNGPWLLWFTRDMIVYHMKPAVGARLVRDPKRKTQVTDYLLADVAMELGFNPKHVVELMSGRSYKWK